MTASEWLYEISKERELDKLDLEKAKQMENQRVIEAIIYALDEDGHTGDWKIKFAREYVARNN